MKARKRRIIREAWRLAKPYWTSEEKWSAWGLLLAIVVLNLGNVYVGIRINQWNRSFYNALQMFDSEELFRQLGIFCIVVVFAISMSVYGLYLNQMLQIRWRRWLTHKYLADWLTDRAYYKLQLGSTTDNPDQRIAEDLSQFTGFIMNLSVGLISSVASLVSFLVILWGLSGTAQIPLGRWGALHIPAYLVWAALLYASIGTWLTVKIGRPLVPLNFDRQRFEADFRFSLVRLRENAESVALYGGEAVERDIFHGRFRNVFENFWQIMKRQRRLGFFTSGYTQGAVIFPVVIIAPRYFAKLITLGGLMQVVNAFSFVQNALSFVINSYPDIATLEAVTQRLRGFQKRLNAVHQGILSPRRIVIQQEGLGIVIRGLDLDLPDGRALLRGFSLELAAGDAVFIGGPSGSGKSTLLRAIAGLWPFGCGTVTLGKGRMLSVPQRPYLPLGTLAGALVYPDSDKNSFSAAQLAAALEEVGLGMLTDELDIVENWSQRLSFGEQQRLALARILLVKPAILFLDEATSALDEVAETQFYRLLRAAEWRPTVVSVGHRRALYEFHDSVVDLVAFKPRREPAPLSGAMH
jgi:vitamin B12/bleomycin/antimicrobial peptide transport system ATP-binding/permease protein